MSLMGTETQPEIKEVIIVGRTVAVIVVCDMGTTCGDIGDYFDDEPTAVRKPEPFNMYLEIEPSWQKLNKGLFTKKQRRGGHAY